MPTFREDQLERHLRLGEDSRWEFKSVEFAGRRLTSPRRDDLADEIAAFANADGGVLLCGVTDNGDVPGLTREQMDTLERVIVELCTDAIRPLIRVAVYRAETESGRALLAVDVPAGDAQHDSPGGAFIRVGSSKRPMTSDERLRLAQRRSQARYRWFDEQPVPGTGFASLEPRLWKRLLSAEGAAEPEPALEKLGVLTRDERDVRHATVAGVLLCTERPTEWLPQACLSAALYGGLDRSSPQINAHVFDGPLDQQVRDALSFVVRNMRIAARKEPGRIDLPEYSDQAVFEALVNAVVHRDYTIRGSRIRLAMFDDRLVLSSPGSLPNNLTIDSISERQAARNQTIASLMSRLNVGDLAAAGGRQFFMERRGDGLPIIRRETYRLTGRYPEYRLIDDAELRVAIPAAPLDLDSPPANGDPNAQVVVRSGSEPLSGVDVLALFPNGTWKQATTDSNGTAAFSLHSTRLPMTVFAAKSGCLPALRREWLPADGPLQLQIDLDPSAGSIIFTDGTGVIPGLQGQLNPIRDALDRTYLYASNIAINEGAPQPVIFALSEELRLVDAEGARFQLRIHQVIGSTALIEYRLI